MQIILHILSSIFYYLIQFHPWIGIISGGVAETKEAEEKEKKKKEMKNQDKEEQDGEAMMMEEIDED